MSNVSYDLDTSGGLMPLIRALIKPPDEEASTHKAKKPQHPYYKRPGKGHNRDCCDACGEGGDLICCDRCPASFHLGCYDPPLDENDIPAGLWLCKQCRGYDAEQPSSSRSSRAQSPADKSDPDRKSRSLKKKIKEDKEKEGDDGGETEAEKESNPMEVLVKAAKIMNPKQFELPREMQVPCIFPGTEKEGSKTGNATVITSDAGCVPAKSCHVCAAGCRKAPLLQCDYCPLLFHQDCLDPPLTALPTGRWMCPNHVEQYIDWKLVNSVSMTERVALWDQFSGPVDQHAIKVDFIRRARGNRPFRMKVPAGARARVVVPEMVRAHYRRPPPLLPSRREFVRCANVLKNLKASGTYDESEEEGEVTEQTKHKICLNLSCPQYSGAGPCPEAPGDASDAAEDADDADHMEVDELAGDDEGSEGPQPDPEASSSDPDDSDDGEIRTKEVPAAGEAGSGRPRLRLRESKTLTRLLAVVDEELKDLDANTIKVLAYQMMEQIAAGEAVAGRWRGSRAGTWATRATAGIGRAERGALQRLGVRLMPLPSALLPPAERRRIARAVWGAAPASPAPAAPPPADRLADRLVRAALVPLHVPDGMRDGEATLGEPVAMRAATFAVGTLDSCDLVLSTACRRVSHKHALIFCDQVTGHYELINYSEWGTVVNGTLYACDTSPHAPPAAADAPAPADPDAPAPAAASPERPERRGRVLHFTKRSWSRCRCPARAQDTAGAWEGAALLPHAALLQFGCLRYVFSVLDSPPA